MVYQGIRTSLIRKLPLFYSYICFVLAEELARFIGYHLGFLVYQRTYWATQFLGLAVGCVVIFEIYRVGLKGFPGTARIARNLLLFVFAMVFAKAIVTGISGWSTNSYVALERDLRVVQGSAFVAVLIVFVIYAIPTGRNLKGILLGYGIFLATAIVQLTVMVYLGGEIRQVWSYVQASSYLLVLCIWTASLRKPAAEIESHVPAKLEEDYRVLREATLRLFRRSRQPLNRAVRP